MSNANINRAKRGKKDEFYTQLADIERELNHDEYRAFLVGKTVCCNCDDFCSSQFWRYFADNFEAFGLRKLIATGYATDGDRRGWRGVWAVMTSSGLSRGYLNGNGDFRSAECIEFLKQADVVVTNPPFSLFREYVAQLMQYDKKFVIIGNINSLTYKEIFPLIMKNKMWLGYGMGRAISGFIVPEYYGLYGTEARIDEEGKRIVATNQCLWYTNIPLKKRQEELPLTFKYSPERYPKYDNYDAIEVSKVAEIPCDYFADMGVSITFLDKYNPDQFEIVGNEYTLGIERRRAYLGGKRLYARTFIRRKCNGAMGVPITYLDKHNPEQFEIVDELNAPVINGERIYKRIIIRRKQTDDALAERQGLF